LLYKKEGKRLGKKNFFDYTKKQILKQDNRWAGINILWCDGMDLKFTHPAVKALAQALEFNIYFWFYNLMLSRHQMEINLLRRNEMIFDISELFFSPDKKYKKNITLL
jgi:hypothetical protein